ncbi:MAG: hypothetical protein AAF191_18345, partial [Verrucomicrobiota bacterium]
EISDADANWIETLEKLAVLNAGGGLPTEILGLASSGDYLLAKQALAFPWKDFYEDRSQAEAHMRGILPIGGGLRQRVIISQVLGRFWVIGDLHERNIMIDHTGVPMIIDALVGKATPLARKHFPWLEQACGEAEIYRESGQRPRNMFEDGNDHEL